jgi:hypothetical protein
MHERKYRTGSAHMHCFGSLVLSVLDFVTYSQTHILFSSFASFLVFVFLTIMAGFAYALRKWFAKNGTNYDKLDNSFGSSVSSDHDNFGTSRNGTLSGVEMAKMRIGV